MGLPSDQFIGRITVNDNGAVVTFRYNTDCFKAISRIGGARYDKTIKSWIVPWPRVPDLLRSPPFAQKQFQYEFDQSTLRLKLVDIESRVSAARERVAKNPFSVSAADIEILEFDVVIGFTADSKGIVCRTARSRRAKKILQELPYLTYGKKDRGYVGTSLLIQDLLKFLRDSELSFAVHEDLAERLKKTTGTRSAAKSRNWNADARALVEALLVPFFDFDSKKQAFVLHGRAKKPAAVSTDKALELLHKSFLSYQPISLTSAAATALQPTIDGLLDDLKRNPFSFPDEVAAFIRLPVSWRTDANGRGILALSKETWTSLQPALQALETEAGVSTTISDSTYLLKPLAIKTAAFFDDLERLLKEHGISTARSRGFKRYLEVVRARGLVLSKQIEFQQLRDCKLDLHRSEHADRLYPHQRVAVSWLLENSVGMLGDDMGLGKTLSVLTAYSDLKYRHEVELLLCICPNSLVRNWLRESRQWFPGIACARIPETKRERKEFLEALVEGRDQALDVLVLNFESMRLEDVWPALQALTARRKTFLCIDESQRMKNPQSKTFAALKEFALQAKRRVLLSGTPTPKDISDIWAQMFIIDGGERFGRSFYNWLGQVAELGTKWSEFAVKRFIPDAVEDAVSRVHEVLLRRKKEEVIDLPEKIFLFRDVEMGSDQKRRYDQIKDELRLEITNAAGKASSRTIESLLEQYLRAVQAASNPRLIDPNWKGDPAKFVELDDIVADIVQERGEKLVIWTNYLQNVRELSERYAKLGAKQFSGEIPTDERAATISRFQDSIDTTTRILIAVPAAGGVGITLTAAQTAVYIDRTWNAEHWLQSIDRIHRIGQQGAVRIIVLNACKVDELIGFNLRKKAQQMEQLLTGNESFERLLPSMQELLDALS